MPTPLDEALLEDATRLRERDRADLLRRTAMAGASARESADLAAEAGVLRLVDGGVPRAVVVAGTGEGAQLAALLTALGGSNSTAPVLTAPAAGLPVWVGVPDLVVVAAGAPTTEPAEDLLAIADTAARRGSALLGIGPAGGPLHDRCARARAPYVALPTDRGGTPGLWQLAAPLLILARALGLVDAAAGELGAAADAADAMAERCRPAGDSFVNPAKALVLQLAESVPVLVGAGPIAGLAAARLADRLGLLAGVPATSVALPGGLRRAAAYLTGSWAPDDGLADLFDDRIESPGPMLRLVIVRGMPEPVGDEAVRELVLRAEHAGVAISEVAAPGDSPIAVLAGLITLGDFATAYLRLAGAVPGSGAELGSMGL